MNGAAKKRYKDIDFPFICPISERKFDTSSGLAIYITKTLKMNHEEYYNLHINHRENTCFFCGNKGKFISVAKGYRNLCENEDCIKKSFHSNSVEGIMYKDMCSREEAENRLIIERKLQEEKKIITVSRLRENDPLWDKKRCRNSLEFWTSRGYSEEEALIKKKEVMVEIHEKTFKKLLMNPEKYLDKHPTRIEYYLKRGYSENEAKIKLSERQRTFSKEICIKKHGEELGLKIFQERQNKWIETLNKKTDAEKAEINRKKINKIPYSQISQKLFWELYEIVGNTKTVFAENKGEFYLKNEANNWFCYDYVDHIRKKCIEFNGDFWHCNPSMYESEHFHPVKMEKAKEIWKFDEAKIKLIEKKDYEVLVIWETDYRNNPQQILQNCIEFINK